MINFDNLKILKKISAVGLEEINSA